MRRLRRPKGNPEIRRQLRGEIRSLLWDNWLIVTGLVLLWAFGLVVLITLFVVTGGWDFRTGLFIGLWVAVAVWWLHHFLAWTGFRHRQMGLVAEAETGRILNRLGRRWQVESNVLIDERYDIDHVVIGSDRVYACETKWTSTSPDREGWMSRVARGRADGLNRALAAEGVDIEVFPVLVLWGREASRAAAESRTTAHGVRVVAGVEWRTWLSKLDATGRGDARPEAVAAIKRIRTPLGSPLPAD